MKPNVILIVLDSARRDALEPYGAAPGASPSIAGLAARGSASPHVYAAGPWTLPSHAAMLSGLMPRSLGLGQAPTGSPQSAKPILDGISDRLLPAVLRENGYRTRGVSTNLWLREASGFANGFDEFAVVDTKRHARMGSEGFRQRAAWRMEAMRAKADDGAREAGELMASWATDDHAEPFFWFVNLVECHSPYLPPRPYNSLGLAGRARAADEAAAYLTLEAIWRSCAGALDVPEAALARMKALYADSIRYLDAWVGNLLEALDRAGKLDDTLVIVTSDHGENFAEADGIIAHAFSLDQRLINVPFVSAGPVELGGAEPFGLVDFPRRLCDALGLERTPYERANPPGIAVSEFDRPAPIEDERWQAKLAEWDHDEDIARPRVGMTLTAATDGRWKLVRRHEDTDLLYDLEADPEELRPLTVDAVDAGTRARLEQAVSGSPDGVGLVMEAATAGDEEISEDERKELEERMRLLGYL